MPQSYKLTTFISLVLIFLLPIFFTPGGILFLPTAKSALFSIGTVLMALAFLYESWKQGGLTAPRHYIVAVVAILPLVYLLSALLSTPSTLSLIGYSLEVGTFGYILLGSAALLISSIIYTDNNKVLHSFVALLGSLSLVALFMIVKLISGGAWLKFGVFEGNLGNPLGSWTDLSVIFGLLAVFATIVLGMIPMKNSFKAILYIIYVVSTALLIIFNFPTAYLLTFFTSLLLLFYFYKVDLPSNGLDHANKTKFSQKTILPLILTLVSLILLINPNVSKEQKLGSYISSSFKINNTDVRPSLSATLGISKAVLSQLALLGSGPNTFGSDWLIYKPLSVNTTPFWSIAFPFGVGFIPTQVATTGILGSALWVIFFVLLLSLGIKALNRLPEESPQRFTLVASFALSTFLWIASLLYYPSEAVLMLAFIFAGIFLSVCRESGVISHYVFNLKESAQSRFLATIAILIIATGSIWVGVISGKKTLASYHFKRANDLTAMANIPVDQIEKELNQSIKLAPLDIYYTALAKINFSKAIASVNSATGTPEQNKKILEESLSKSIQAAINATQINSANYQNWAALGTIYTSMVPPPLSVPGAYEKAKVALNEAGRRNPNNPEIPLLLARLEIAKGNIDAARSYLQSSVALKPDYADAYILSAQLEIQQKNLSGAISSTEAAAILLNNPGLYFELGVLKFAGSDFQGAAQALRKSLSISPDYANAKFYLGLTLAKLGNIEEAIALFEDLKKTNPSNAEVMAALEALNKLLK